MLKNCSKQTQHLPQNLYSLKQFPKKEKWVNPNGLKVHHPV